jgi:fatty acid desaturase
MADHDKRRTATPSQKPYRIGFSFPSSARPHLKSWMRTNFFITLVTASIDHVTIFGIAAVHLYLWALSPGWSLAFYPPAVIIIARQLRGLENLVHEASHQNWCRASRLLNDWTANMFAAFLMFATVSLFRRDHLRHHNHTGTADDPCYRRFVQDLAIDSIDHSSLLAYVVAIVRRMPQYVVGWWTGPSGADRRSWGYGAVYHAAIVAAVAIVFGTTHACGMWIAYFGIPFAFVLPVIRFAAESEKHSYTDNDGTVFGATYNNVGWLHAFIHPHGDTYHLVHHMHPAIPHHQLRNADRWLTAHSEMYRGSLRRTSLLEPRGGGSRALQRRAS